MTFRTVFSSLLIFSIFACSSESNNESSSIRADNPNENSDSNNSIQTDISQNGKTEYANIVRIIQKGDTTFLDADYIQYLTGQAAIEAAKKLHQADTFQSNDGKTHIDVPNDYFILNESKKIRHLPIAKECVFDLIINPDRVPISETNSLNSLKKIYSNSPFILTFSDVGDIIKIKEVFTP